MVGRRADCFTPFRYFANQITARCRNLNRKGFDPNEVPKAEELRDLFLSQKGKCPITGWDLILPKGSGFIPDPLMRHKFASMDRINSKIGYVRGNIQFVALIANLAKNQFTMDQLKEFCVATSTNFG